MKLFTYIGFTIASISKNFINLAASVHHVFSDNVVQYSIIQIPWASSWYFRGSDTLATEKIVVSLEVLKKVSRTSLHGLLWYLLTTCLPLHQLLQLWRLFTQVPGPSPFLEESEETPQNTEVGHRCTWTNSWRRHPNGILLWPVVQPKYRFSNIILAVTT